MRYELSDQGRKDGFFVPRRAAEFFAEAGECELRVLLFVCENPAFEEEELFEALSGLYEPSSLREALAFWRGAGLFKRRGAKAAPKKEVQEEPKAEVKIVSSRPSYTAQDLAEAVEQTPDFKSLVDYAEARLEKLLNRADLSLLYSFVDYLGLPVDVVMLAMESCIKEGKKSLRYIEKLLVALTDDGIVTYEDADAYFARRAEYLSYEGQIRTMCGFSSRALTAAEKKLITSWKEEKGYTAEELEAAYEKTIAAISKPSLSYMNKVLSTLRSAPQGDGADREKQGRKTYETSSRFAKAVARTKKKQKTEENE